MTESVTLQLPNELALTAKTVARNTKRPLEDILVEWLDRAAAELPVESLNLMQLYRQGLVRKAEAFKVAVDHDLLLPLGE